MKAIFKTCIVISILLFSSGLVFAEEGNFSSLNNTINSNEESVKLNKNYKYDKNTDSGFENGITISKDNFIVDGNYFTVDGSNSARIFQITGNNITIKNIRIINGFLDGQYIDSPKHGGGIYNYKANNTKLINITLENNEAYRGGGIYNEGGNNFLIAGNSNINNNTAQEGGGGIYNRYGDNFLITGNNNINNNYAEYNGGGIFNVYSNNFTINGTNNINYNYVEVSGGGIYNSYSNNFFIIGNNNINYNYAEYNAGGICNNLYSENFTLSGNNNINYNIAENSGGGLYLSGPNFIITGNNNINHNIAKKEGGGIYVSSTGKNFIIKNGNNFINNSAKDNGGAICILSTNFTITGAFFKDNNANKGSSIYTTKDDGEINYNVILDQNPVHNSGKNKNFNYNWWGTNNITHIKESIDGNYILTNHYVVNLVNNAKNPIIGDIYNLNYILELNNSEDSNVLNLPLFNVTILLNEYKLELIDGRLNQNITFEINSLNNKIEAIFNDKVIANLSFVASAGSTQIIIDTPTDAIFDETYEIIIKLINQNNKSIPNQKISYSINGIHYYNITDENGNIIISFKANTLGPINVIATFDGNNYYNNSYNTTKFNVKSIPKLDITVDNVKDNENATIHVSLKDHEDNGINGTVTLYINNKKYDVAIINGKGSITIDKLPIGTYTINARFNGNELYFEVNNNNVSFNVKSIPKLDITVEDIKDNENATIHVTLRDNENNGLNGTVTLYINNKKYDVTIINGKGTITINKLPIGTYTVNAKFNGNELYLAVNNNASFNVKSIPKLDITVEDIKDNENATIHVSLRDNENNGLNGTVTLYINNKKYDVTIINGKGTITIDKLPIGTYTINARFDGNELYLEVSNNVSFNVKTSKENISVDIPKEINITTNTSLPIKINENATGNLILKIGNKTYDLIIKNGQVIFDINNLEAGTYYGELIYSGDENFNSFNLRFNLTINKGNVLLDGNNIIMFYKDGNRYIVKLTDINGNPIANSIIAITINGITYYRTTNENGTAFLSINLIPGNYTIESFFNETERFNSKTIINNLNIKPTIIGKDIVKHYLNDTQYTVTVLDKNGNPLNNVNVTFNINGMMYYRTAVNGKVTLNINLFPGNYTITATSPDGLSISNNILVKSTLIGNDTIKTFGKPGTYDILVLDNVGNPLQNIKISININGMFYEVISDINGIAKLNINLNPGSYIATATWGTYSTSNWVNVTI